jgi:hypothetical protein
MPEGCGSIKSHLEEVRRTEDVVQNPRVRYLVYPKPDTRNLG